MATIKRVFIFLTSIASGLGVLFTLVALVTEQWVVTDSAYWVDSTMPSPNTIRYGLFQGYYKQQHPSPTTVQIIMTCLFKENVCALLCGRDDDERYNLLRQLYSNDSDINFQIEYCPAVQGTFSYSNRAISTYADESSGDKKFINAGVWVSTIFFLVLSIAAGLIASALAIWNIVSNPVQVYLSIFGLYIYNGVALGCTVIGMCLWGIMHLYVMFHDVGIIYTLMGLMNSDKAASLGFSFWLLIIPIVMYSCSIVLLYIRHLFLSRDPGHKIVHREETADPGIYLY